MRRLFIIVSLPFFASCPAQQVGDPFIQLGDPFTLATSGSCPMFHCDPEGTGLMNYPIPKPTSGQSVVTVWTQENVLSNGALNKPGVQGCSSDGSDFTCLYAVGPVTAMNLDAETLAPAHILTSSKLDITGTFAAVALHGQDGSIIVADGDRVKRLVPVPISTQYPNGFREVWSKRFTAGVGVLVLGIVPLQYTEGSQTKTVVAVTYNNGRILVFDPAYGYDPSDGLGIIDLSYDVGRLPASPPVAHGNSLYFIAAPTLLQSAFLRKLDLQNGAFTKSAEYAFDGISGASPVYYVTQDNVPLVLVHVPFGIGDCGVAIGNHIVALAAGDLSCEWTTALISSIQVSPVVDPVRGGVWLFQLGLADSLEHINDDGVIDDTIRLADLLKGTDISTPRFIGHLYSVQPPDDSSVYVVSVIGGVSGTGYKYAIAVNVSTGSLLWVSEVGGLGSLAYGAALPLVTLADGQAGMVVSWGAYATLGGNVLILAAK